MGALGLAQFVEEIGWVDGKGQGGNGGIGGDSEVSLTPWEAALAELAAYGASDVYDSEAEGYE
jgi:hypothetical protein